MKLLIEVSVCHKFGALEVNEEDITYIWARVKHIIDSFHLELTVKPSSTEIVKCYRVQKFGLNDEWNSEYNQWKISL